MMEVKKIRTRILILCAFLMLTIVSYSQELSTDSTQIEAKISLPDLNLPFFALNQVEISPVIPSSIMHRNAVFSADQLPIFCKIEHLLGLQSQFPVKIRLGDVDYVDNLESK